MEKCPNHVNTRLRRRCHSVAINPIRFDPIQSDSAEFGPIRCHSAAINPSQADSMPFGLIQSDSLPFGTAHPASHLAEQDIHWLARPSAKRL